MSQRYVENGQTLVLLLLRPSFLAFATAFLLRMGSVLSIGLSYDSTRLSSESSTAVWNPSVFFVFVFLLRSCV